VKTMTVKRAASIMLVGLAWAFVQSCAGPTRIVLRISTDVDCGKESPTPVISVGSLESGFDTVPTARQKCRSQRDQGFLVVVPSTSKDSPVSIQVAMRLRPDLEPASEDCSKTSSEYCIVSRVRLRYQPNETIEIPVELNLGCKGVTCSEFETCNRKGQCVSADVTGCASPEGCNPSLQIADSAAPPAADVGTPDATPTDAKLSRSDSGTCSFGGKDYAAGETFPAGDGCNDCTCLAGMGVSCTQKACVPGDGGTL
jgi:hypothetical protein